MAQGEQIDFFLFSPPSKATLNTTALLLSRILQPSGSFGDLGEKMLAPWHCSTHAAFPCHLLPLVTEPYFSQIAFRRALNCYEHRSVTAVGWKHGSTKLHELVLPCKGLCADSHNRVVSSNEHPKQPCKFQWLCTKRCLGAHLLFGSVLPCPGKGGQLYYWIALGSKEGLSTFLKRTESCTPWRRDPHIPLGHGLYVLNPCFSLQAFAVG